MADTKPMQSWACVEVGAKDSRGIWGTAIFQVLTHEDCSHNEVKKLTPEFVEICVGSQPPAGRKGGGKEARQERDRRLQRELSGFFRELFDAKEDQIRLDVISKKTKVVQIADLDRDKRSLLWLLQSKVRQKYEAHWATDFANAELNAGNTAALKRKAEAEDFQKLQEEALSASSLSRLPPFGAPLGVPARESGTKRAREQKATTSTGAKAAQSNEESSSKAAPQPSSETAGNLGGLAGQYDSESSDGEDESEPEKLANPFS
eukprot:TRINITY_DN66524_c0_g1_i1.p1 TRINITY_DN66524_c0_g1~~TRINITY_DN66524_c0_g1_i1.p1  ORF type:complete len:262 (-),score=79.41 TRINITY_DN66524_c0_g1_i1:2-787(-)